MNNKKSQKILFLGGIIVAALFGLVIRYYQNTMPIQASSLAPVSLSGGNSANFEEIKNEAVNQERDEFINPEVVNFQEISGIEVVASNYRLENNRLFVDVCFDRPNSADWVIRNASITTGSNTFPLSGSNLIEVREAPINGKQNVSTLNSAYVEKSDGRNKGRRCDALYFDINPELDNSVVILNIQSIIANPREGETCTPAYLEKVQKALDAKINGVKIECLSETYADGGGSYGLGIVSKPEAITDAAIQEILMDPSFFESIHGIQGPWTFSGNIE
jgi:hypothetical protein